MDYYTLKSDMTSRENSQGEMNVCERPCGVVSGAAIVQMKVQVDLSRLRMTKWSEYGLRVLFDGTITVVAGILAERFGPEFGGLFLAFPAIFPATATLIEKHERKRTQKAARGREAAALDARGVTMGSIGLIGFALVTWKLLPIWNGALTLFAALLAWTALSVLIWRLYNYL
jgi:Protein of unknown function (DUF3147)